MTAVEPIIMVKALSASLEGMGRRFCLTLCVLCAVTFGCKTDESSPPSSSPPATANTITLNPSIVYQTMNGWEEPTLSTVLDYASILPFMGPLLDQAVNDLGLNKMTIGVSSGAENPSDACQLQYLNRTITEGVFVSNCLYNSVNDNADPAVINPNGFHFVILDWQIDNLLLPLKQRVQARGEKLYIQLRYVDFGSSSFEHFQNPDEYAELMQAAFDHMRTKYGFVPDGIDVMNEPDQVAGWDSTAMGRVIARTGQRLAALGYEPDFIGPSSVDKGRAVPYFDGMMAVPGVNRYLKDLSWHCYANSTGASSSASIAAKAIQYGVRTSMTECWNASNTYLLLHQELKTSRNASWQLATINGVNGYYDVNTSTGQATLRPKAKYIRQYFKYIRSGARRIEATSTNASFDPVAFINTDGKYVVVVKATAAGTFTVGNLPAATYGIFYTTGPDGLTVSNYDVNGGDQTITAGRSLTAMIPGAGVLTIYAKTRGANSVATSLTPAVEATERMATGQPGVQEAQLSSAPAWPVGTRIATRDGVRLRLEQIGGEIADPVDLAFTPDGRVLMAERGGTILVVRDGQLLAQPALALDQRGDAQEELLALAVDPSFDRTHYLYTISTIAGIETGGRTFSLSRYREAGDTLADRIVLLDDIPSAPGAAAASLRFGPDGKLFAAFDDAGVAALEGDLASVNGKVLRLNPDGSTPDDQAGGNPLFSYSYRSPHGIDWHPATQTLWVADQYVEGSGQLDVVDSQKLRPKRGVRRTTFVLPKGTDPSSMAFYTGTTSTALRNNLFVASDQGRHLLRVQLDPMEPTRVLTTERLLENMVGGIRVVGVARDGAIYIGTAKALGRLVPVQ